MYIDLPISCIYALSRLNALPTVLLLQLKLLCISLDPLNISMLSMLFLKQVKVNMTESTWYMIKI